ncbi:uncharacterized protein LOC130725279 [Lotus japonicus]|uniref:uncharacterized protein LOC130725279 n=1 Tax=Lotus japonicus TaxID=34305 RepID=UPI0025871850|nr:uncharacterized protein LOC130725279 [Lotus japonicus]
MASRIDDLAKVDASKETWTIVAKVNHLWLSPSLYGSKLPFSMDMILMEDKGCKIHATVRKTLIYRFQSLLAEGKVYQISYFGVGESGCDFRPTEHPFKINFDIQTSVRLLPNKAINITSYSFVPLADIMYKELDTSFLIDVIGILTGASKWRTRVRKGWVWVECAFFGKYVSEVIGYLSSVDATNAIVVRLASKMFMVLLGFFFFTGFWSQMILQHKLLVRFKTLQKKISLEEDFLKKSDGKIIEQLKDLAEKSFCVEQHDEIKQYLTPCEAAWRTFKYDIHNIWPPVLRLGFHLPNQQSVLFKENDDLEVVMERSTNKGTQFLAWMDANKKYQEGRNLTYA